MSHLIVDLYTDTVIQEKNGSMISMADLNDTIVDFQDYSSNLHEGYQEWTLAEILHDWHDRMVEANR